MIHGDFSTFFQAVHGTHPFPWQSELARVVATERRWPELLDLPTGAGKTAVIDIAVFTLALEACLPALQPRSAAMRTFFVVDRRIVVDEAARRARKVARKLQRALNDPAEEPILREMAQRLVQLAGMSPDQEISPHLQPLRVAALRGGMYRDDSWAYSPAQPIVAVSTVDQLGSRLLFRGYGLGRSGRVVHAGLVGADSLILVDEAHLSRPFLATVKSIEMFRQPGCLAAGTLMPPFPFQVVQMSATSDRSGVRFTLTDKDRKDQQLSDRLTAKKVALLDEEVSTTKDHEAENRQAFTQRVVERAMGLIHDTITDRGGAYSPKVVGIVVNRVDTARRVFDRLRSDPTDHDAILLTGRIRPLDREELLGAWLKRMKAGRDRAKDPQRPLFVVATQTIEVGADLDFDALVTEIAPLDALRQRFGRVDRLGKLGLTRSVIIARKDAVATAAEDPIYGKALAATWKWLLAQAASLRKKNRQIEFGIDAMTPLIPTDLEELKALCSPRADAPVLLPTHIDNWVQTDPIPCPDPDVSFFLHGPKSTADVQIVWRADLPFEKLADLSRQPLGAQQKQLSELTEECTEIVSLVPPSGLEALTVPVHAARSWLKQAGEIPIADIEGAAIPEQATDRPAGRFVLQWRGPDESRLIGPDEIRPGDTLVVPSEYGGSDEFGWDPDARESAASVTRVKDIGDLATLLTRGKPSLRIHPAVIADWQQPALPEVGLTPSDAIRALLRPTGQDDDEESRVADVIGVLEAISRRPDLPFWVEQACQLLKSDRNRRILRYKTADFDEFFVLRGGTGLSSELLRSLLAGRQIDEDGEIQPDFDPDGQTDDDASSLGDVNKVMLSNHCDGVATLAAEFAKAVGLPSHLVADLERAGRLHDIGKADPRFQVWLHGGDEIAAAMEPEPLAKSTTGPQDRVARRLARRLAGYPEGARHEAVSAALISCRPEVLAEANDPDLVLHLVGCHHGYGRPFWPAVSEPANPTVLHQLNGWALSTPARHGLERLGSGWVDRFWFLVRCYGPWGLALLESILILADHHRSRTEQEIDG